MHKIGGTHLQCVNNHYAMFEYKGMKTVTQSRHPLSISDGKKVVSSTPVKNEKIFMKCAQNGRCTSSNCAKFEYKGMKTVGVTDYTNQTPSKQFEQKNALSSTPLKNEKIFMKCAQNRRCTSYFMINLYKSMGPGRA